MCMHVADARARRVADVARGCPWGVEPKSASFAIFSAPRGIRFVPRELLYCRCTAHTYQPLLERCGHQQPALGPHLAPGEAAPARGHW